MAQNKGLKPDFKPRTRSSSDVRHIDKEYLRERPVDSPVFRTMVSSHEDFENFTYKAIENEYDMNIEES